MGRNAKNLLGFKTENLEVISGPVKDKGYISSWLCKCVCGKEFIARAWHIENQPNKSCGCRNFKIKNHPNKKFEDVKEASYKNLYSMYKQSSIKKNLEWNITLEDFKELISNKCTYCDTEPYNTFNAYQPKNGKSRFKYSERPLDAEIKYNGVDRQDSNLGYTKENTVSCCKIRNYAKNTLTLEEFMCWIKRLIFKYKE